MKKIILAIETAVNVCSVALAFSKKEILLKESFDSNSHASNLHVFVEELLTLNSLSYTDISAVVVSAGPGSYTGLRIGVSAAKGYCYALNIPLISVFTLDAMALSLINQVDFDIKNSIIQPMIDARRMEVFTTIYNRDLTKLEPYQATVLDSQYFDSYNNEKQLIIGGNGAVKFKPLTLNNANIILVENNIHSSASVAYLAFEKFENKDFEDLHYFEPYYLKDYIPGKAKVKGLI